MAVSFAERRLHLPGQALWQRFIIVAAGPLTNFLFAIVAFMIIFASIGYPTTPASVGTVAPGSVAAASGFRPGDQIVAADGRVIDTFADLQTYVALRPEQEMAFTVRRAGGEIEIRATPRAKIETDQFGNEARIGQIGITPGGALEFSQLPLHRLPGAAVSTTVKTVERC